MEVMHHGMEEEEEVEVAEQLRTRRSGNTVPSGDITSSSSSDDSGSDMQEVDNNGISEKSVYFDKNEGTTLQLSLSGNDLRLENVDIPKLVSAVINNQNRGNVKDEIMSVLNTPTLKPTSGEEENIGTRGGVHENVSIDLMEENDEEVIELEFERAVEKVHTHTAYCPNCSSQITKVILRRRKREDKVRSTADSLRRDKPVDLFGCLSCFRIFIPSGKGLNPFGIFGPKRKHESAGTVEEKHTSGANLPAAAGGSTNADGSTTVKQGYAAEESTALNSSTGSTFDLFWIFRRRRENENGQGNNDLIKHEGESSHVPLLQGSPSSGHKMKDEDNGNSEYGHYHDITQSHPSVPSGTVATEIGDGAGNYQVKHKGGSNSEEENSLDNSIGALPVSSLHVPLLHGSLSSGHTIKDDNIGSSETVESQKTGDYPEITPPHASVPSGDVAIEIGDGIVSDEEIPVKSGTDQHGGIGVNAGKQAVISDTHGSKSLEILKCIVYGGLIVSITSLSVVSSAAASDANTLNIIAIGLATVISGLIVFGHNLMDLRNDRGNSNQHTDKYHELLGRRGHFLLHAPFAILSFLVFGLIPPVVYGFTFRQSDNKDYKILAVAAASFTCIFILAIAKAYAQRLQKFSEYVKTILYYVTLAISVSGVSYAAGDLIKMLMERLGWFEPTPAATSFIPEMISATPTWASY